MEKKILINARHPEEKRVAIVQDGRLSDFYVEVSSAGHLKGSIYKGVVTSVDRGLQAAFVDFGPEKHGFLPLREVPPSESSKKKGQDAQHGKPHLTKGQEILVQVEHDQRGSKGASLTGYLSLPGRYLVMMPGEERIGISRKIDDRKAREQLKEAFKDLKTPKGMGFIVRTAGLGRSTEELSSDLKYLTKLWSKMQRESKKAKAPCLVYKEQDIAVRTVRDYLTNDVTEVLVDDMETQKGVKNFLKLTMPWFSINVTHYKEERPLFDMHDLEDQISLLYDRKVALPSGGSIVIDKAEALTAIDVNSGRGKDKDIEALALKTDMEAADEIARQLRLRDIGGLIVIDFIDLESNKQYQQIEDRMRALLNQDKAHYDMSRISKFGIMEISRERMRTAYFDSMRRACPVCEGAGHVKSAELVALSAIRKIHTLASGAGARKVVCRLPVESANHMLNSLYQSVETLRKEYGLDLTLLADAAMPAGRFEIESDGVVIETAKPAEDPRKKSKRSKRRKKKPSDAASAQEAQQRPMAKQAETSEESSVEPAQEDPSQTAAKSVKKKRRGRRGGRRSGRKKPAAAAEPQAE